MSCNVRMVFIAQEPLAIGFFSSSILRYGLRTPQEMNAMAALTAELGHFVSKLALKDIPMEAQAVAKTGITDCFGVMIAGARDPVVGLLDRELAGADGAALA